MRITGESILVVEGRARRGCALDDDSPTRPLNHKYIDRRDRYLDARTGARKINVN
jgi:hypothetical protein